MTAELVAEILDRIALQGGERHDDHLLSRRLFVGGEPLGKAFAGVR